MFDEIEALALEACAEHNTALYDIEIKNTLKGRVLLVYITKVDGVQMTDCAAVSRTLSTLLDEKDYIDGSFFLEVSSPGVERSLRLKKHYVGAINETIKIAYAKEGKKVVLSGILVEVLPATFKLRLEDGSEEVIDFHDVKKAKTVFDYKSSFSR